MIYEERCIRQIVSNNVKHLKQIHLESLLTLPVGAVEVVGDSDGLPVGCFEMEEMYK